ncbi:hypothetical protein [Stratiformator vulcanicus]|uniref:DUF1877 family protein n=1 Tax=Stratiformator vulcanicus TaxID=2527980 RepID=A0A517QY07_9PLAN|nr:hypothetical protein [Stratiformator vulcanicus]QDT36531.1 hypothetical protein Pan189_08900 [Stratiformator vulcanicus]
MATYLCIFVAPDHHIDFIKSNPDSLWAYVEGSMPEIQPKRLKRTLWQRLTGQSVAKQPAAVVPEDWPDSEAIMIGPEVNHRNVDLYHLLLNGTSEFVDGSGSIFQTWLTNHKHSAINLTGEDYAFKSEQLPKLAKLIAAVDPPAIKSRYTEWLRTQGETFEPSDDECDELVKEFSDFADSTRDVVNRHLGLIWVSS